MKVNHWRGVNYAALEDYASAIENYTRAIELNPDDADAYFARSYAYNTIGNTEAADADRERMEQLQAGQ